MKQIVTDKMGVIEYSQKDIIFFEKGLLGFEEYQEYILIRNAQNGIFFFLQSVGEPHLMFILISPKMILPDYKLEIHESEVADFDTKNLIDFCIVTIPKETMKTTMNSLGPLVVDLKKQIGKQVVSLDPGASTQQPLVLEQELPGVAV